MKELTQEKLKELLHFDPETGVFTWLVSRGRMRVGDIAGSLNITGYAEIGVLNTTHKAHRLAWLYIHGVWPVGEIDHVNRVKNDNRIANLREATRSNNQHNQGKYANNTSGYKGVHWCKRDNSWIARIGLDGNKVCLGYFDNPEAAHLAYCEAAKDLHKQFARSA